MHLTHRKRKLSTTKRLGSVQVCANYDNDKEHALYVHFGTSKKTHAPIDIDFQFYRRSVIVFTRSGIK